MHPDFISAVKRIVESSEPPRWRPASPTVSLTPEAGLPRQARPEAVQGLTVRRHLGDGSWAIAWAPVHRAEGYEIQANPDPSKMVRWFERGRVVSTTTQISIGARTERLWVRVRAFGSSGSGPWSDPILLKRPEQAMADVA